MKKLFFSFLVLLATCTHVFAYSGQGFKILHENLTNVGFVGNGVENVILPSSYADALTMTADVQGHVHTDIQIHTWHSVMISNYTKQKQRYTYTFVLSCENAYQRFARTIELEPGGNFSDSQRLYGSIRKDELGTYPIHGVTKIEGESFSTRTADAILRTI